MRTVSNDPITLRWYIHKEILQLNDPKMLRTILEFITDYKKSKRKDLEDEACKDHH